MARQAKKITELFQYTLKLLYKSNSWAIKDPRLIEKILYVGIVLLRDLMKNSSAITIL